jgi:hypothetical protein
MEAIKFSNAHNRDAAGASFYSTKTKKDGTLLCMTG